MRAKSPIELRDGVVYLSIRVQPKASRNALRTDDAGCLCASVSAPPVDGKANRALEALVAKALGIRKSAVTVVRGERSRNKTLSVEGASLGEVREKLLEL